MRTIRHGGFEKINLQPFLLIEMFQMNKRCKLKEREKNVKPIQAVIKIRKFTMFTYNKQRHCCLAND